MIKRFMIVMLTLFSIAFASAQDVRYYKLTRKVEKGNSITNVSGGQYITFTGKICFESNNHGVGVNHGTMERNDNYSNSQYSVYQQKTGSGCYWGKEATFKFNSDKSVLNVLLDNDDVYVYKRSNAPTGQETCSLIRKSGGEGEGCTSISIYPPQPNPIVPPVPSSVIIPTTTPSSSPDYREPSKPHSTDKSNTRKCPRCNGKGRIVYDTHPPMFGLDDYKVKCNECGEYHLASTGHSHITCPLCHGKGY